MKIVVVAAIQVKRGPIELAMDNGQVVYTLDDPAFPIGGLVMAEDPILVVSSDEVPSRTIVRTLGLVRGHSVRARNLGRDIQAGVRAIVGGRVGVYAELLEKSREEAIGQMIEAAEKLGANAIVAVRLSTSQVMGGAAEVLSYGTAVITE
ncbi:MAG: YbjQ family protein [Dehalococcoidia bacterium]